MLYRASVLDLKQNRLSRRYSHTAIVMQYYPRFLPKELVDEYVKSLAPDKALFTEFKAQDRATKDHNGAFTSVNYEARFQIVGEGPTHLERLTELARARDVFLICQCIANDRCHADLLILLAKHWFRGNTQIVRHDYPIFENRILDGDLKRSAPGP